MTGTNVTGRILKNLEQVRTRAPELRFGQLIAIIGELATDDRVFAVEC